MSYVVAGMAAFQIINGAQQAEMVRAQGEIQKDIAKMNAEFAELDAFHAEADGSTIAARYEGQNDRVMSDQRVAYAAADIDINYGSAAEVVKDSKLAGMLNVLDIKNQAHNKALGYKNQARQYIASGAAASAQAGMNAGAIQSAAVMNAGSTMLSGYKKGKASTSGSYDSAAWAGGDIGKNSDIA